MTYSKYLSIDATVGVHWGWEDAMGRKKSVSFVDEITLAKAEADFGCVPQGKIALRLLAIIAAGHGERLQDIASFFRTTRQTVAAWIDHYRKGGVSALSDRPRGHRRGRLSKEQQRVAQGWLERGEDPRGEPTHWTIDILREVINEQFGVGLGRTRVWQLMRQWGFRPKVARPRHSMADPEAQEEFKKKRETS
jgi:transposase